MNISITPIQKALDAHLLALDGIPQVQLENTRAPFKTGQSFTRATLIPSQPQQRTVGVTGRDMLSGLYQIDLFIPQDTGVDAANGLVDLVLGHFQRGMRIEHDGITVHIQRAGREAGSRHEPFYQAPVTVTWHVIG